MIKAVLFDMDGVLFDSEYYYMHGTIEWMRELGYQGPDAAIYPIIGTTMVHTYDLLVKLLDNRYSIAQITKINEDYFDKLHPLDCQNIMFPGVKETLDKIKALGIKTAVCSSSPKQTIINNLTDMNLINDFDVIASGDDYFESKPNPEIYLHTVSKLGLKPDECIVYEDSHIGIQAGVNAGIFTVAREDKRFNQDQSNANLIVRDIQSLYNWIIDNREK